MTQQSSRADAIQQDVRDLHGLGYAQDHAGGRPLGDRHRGRHVGPGHGGQSSRGVSRLPLRHPQMLEQGTGSVINISSFVALLGCSVPQDAYTASKGAVLSLTRSLAVQFGGRGVRSNAICPGPIETPLLMDWLHKDEEAKRIRLARNPTGRFGRPEEIVNVAVYLASDESRWTNGVHFVIDGGISVNYF